MHWRAAGFILVAATLFADDRSEAVDSLLAPLRVKDGPGCIVQVVQQGKPLYTAAFGLADLEARTPITAATEFNVASLSKQFTAAAIYFLMADGKVRSQDSVRRFLPELPAYADAVTIADLLHHTSGLRDAHPLMEVSGRLNEPLDAAANLQLVARQSGVNFAPGTDYEYTNTDYFLLGLTVERASKVSLARFAGERIFHPLGMIHSAFREGRAGYMADGDRFRKAPPPPLTNGDGGVYTTLEDLRLWDQNLYTGRVGGSGFIHFMETSGRLRSGTPVGYGGGLSVGRYRGARVVSHDGLLAGYRVDFTQFPGRKLSSFFLCNRGDADAPALNRRIAGIYLSGHLKRPHGRATLDYPKTAFPELDGVWESMQGWILRAWSAVDGMTIDTAGEKYKLYALNRRQLFADEGGFRLTLTMLSRDRLTLQWEGSLPVTYQRLDSVMPRAEQRAALAGTYRSADAATTWTLVVDRGELLITTAAGWKIPLDPVGSDRFVVGPWSLHFVKGGIELHRARLWNLRFEAVK